MTEASGGRRTYEYDVLAMGRSSIDLYANEIGAPFTEVKSFSAYVGGSPTNICVSARRLGLRSAMLTAVGEDLVGDFVLGFLAREGVVADFSPRKAGRRTSAFLLAIQPPDMFPIVPYRDNCADLELTADDVREAPVAEARALLVTGSGLSRQPSRGATLAAAETARAHGNKVVFDLDLRAEVWTGLSAYAAAVRSALPAMDVVVGTSSELISACGGVRDLQSCATALLDEGPEAVVVKRGEGSTLVYTRGGEVIEAAPYPVEVLNVLGAGDAFAGGFLYGYLKGWDWYKSARMGNACGALVVTRHGCANFMPYEDEALRFIQERGGF